MFTVRFDMRAKDGPGSTPDLYGCALDIASWADINGGLAIQVCEHHASPDGYLPAPMLLAAAIAARTPSIPISVAALLLPLHDPVVIAEQMCVLDLLSNGRTSYICGIGYRAEEYAMFGRSMATRGRRLDECLGVLRSAFRGEPFEYDGRVVHVTPMPITPSGPALAIGGGSRAAARRAARLGLPLMAQVGDAELEGVYREACRELGVEEHGYFAPTKGAPQSVFVSDDPDRAWAHLGPYLLHDARAYAAWLGDLDAVTKSTAASVEELRAEAGNYRIFTVQEAVDHVRTHGYLPLQPLCGGLPPTLAWQSLELVEARVLPAVSGS